MRGTSVNDTGPCRTLFARFPSAIVPLGFTSARSVVCPDVAKVGSSNRNPKCGSPRRNRSTRLNPTVSRPSASSGSSVAVRPPLETVSVASEMHEPVGNPLRFALVRRPCARSRGSRKGENRWLYSRTYVRFPATIVRAFPPSWIDCVISIESATISGEVPSDRLHPIAARAVGTRARSIGRTTASATIARTAARSRVIRRPVRPMRLAPYTASNRRASEFPVVPEHLVLRDDRLSA